MRKDYSAIVRLHRQGLSKNAIAMCLGCRWETVRDALERCIEAYGSIDSIPEGVTDAEIRIKIAGIREAVASEYLQVDCEEILSRQRNGVMRKTLWAEYVREAERKGLKAYKLSRFNEIVTEFAEANDYAVEVDKAPGFKCEVDWVGDSAYFVDNDTGEMIRVHVFVMALPYSSYFYCEGFIDEKMDSWLDGHMHGFEFFGGVPAVITPDNCRTAVEKGRYTSSYDEVVLNPRYREFADHYGIAVRPARVRKPKDKSVCERCVRIIERDLLDEMKDLDICSLAEFNRLLHAKLLRRLEKPFSRRLGSRRSVFEAEEKPRLSPLPAMQFESYTEKQATVDRTSCIRFDNSFYSVPCEYIRRKVVVRASSSRVLIYSMDHILIAEHGKATHKYSKMKDPSHFKGGIESFGGFTISEFRRKASKYGPHMEALIEDIASSREDVTDAFRTLNGLFHQIDGHIPEAIEAAADIALRNRVFSCKGFRILLDEQEARMWSLSRSARDLNSILCVHGPDREGR